ncbi:MAG TPA: flavohemoglobin expression-modulating QEGLA motif protein [Legionellales bacterium]|nr:flavohemoglobin expression-modulating QEGLA motif protein [Legionellales bacterium]HCA90180.1 flavohemoglobin expression-modulating QEGLA motif protein [Legionellales bacterium]|tara:strand:+ start:63 stop:1358 length:1296 start_codon:yes stop_codon:yes gene_type:complete
MANSAQTKEASAIQALSQRLIEAQQSLRILDSIKWDDTIRQEFFKHKAQKLPNINKAYYEAHPLPFKVNEKVEEFRAILRDAQNQLGQYSPVTRLLKRQCDEYCRAAYMLHFRGTPKFNELSIELYGSPDDVFYASGPKLAELGTMLFETLTALDNKLQSDADIKRFTAEQACELLQKRLNQFFVHHNDKITVTVSDGMVADAAAGADSIKLNQQVQFSARDLNYLEVHEGWVHVGTTLNGLSQPYCSFLAKGSPSSSVIQEGLAVITEVMTFNSYPGRIRKLTNRVIALNKVHHGADFLDIYRYFLACGLDENSSYNHSVRVFRGSTPTGQAFTKDLAYAKGFLLIYNFLRFAISQQRTDMIGLLFHGKLMLDDLPLLKDLQDSQLLKPPLYIPKPFQDLAALSAWMSLSLFLNRFDLQKIEENFRFLLV